VINERFVAVSTVTWSRIRGWLEVNRAACGPGWAGPSKQARLGSKPYGPARAGPGWTANKIIPKICI